MGGPMLTALRDGGANAIGFDVLEKADPHITNNIMGFAPRLETVFVVVRDATETDSLLFGRQNLIQTAPNLKRIFICATLSPRYVKALRNRIPDHITLIDAPLSGAQVAAENRALTFMLGGDKRDIDDAIPLLALMGTQFHHMGDYGAGMQAKVLNDMRTTSQAAVTRLVSDQADTTCLDEDRWPGTIHTASGHIRRASGYDNIECAKDGHTATNTIGILVRDVGAAPGLDPAGADKTRPKTFQSTMRNHTPRRQNRSARARTQRYDITVSPT